jgi:DNA-binding transcriptional LysR family regulator
MELRHLRYFIAVAEELNFGRAARRLHVSQPPLSRQIRDLEEDLHVKLLERDRQGVRLTRVGRALLSRARRIVSDAEALRTQARKLEEERCEELQIGYAPSPTVGIIGGILARYQELAGGAPVTLHDLSLSEILAGLRSGRLHAGLTLRPGAGEARGLRFEAIRRYSVGIICSCSSPFAQLGAVPPSLIPSEGLVGYRSKDFPEYHAWTAKVLGRRKSRVVIAHECDGVMSLIASVESGRGPAVVGEFTGAVAGNRVCYTPFSEKPSSMEVGLLHRQNERRENVRKLISSALEFRPAPKKRA